MPEGITYALDLDNSGFTGGIGGAMGSLKGLATPLAAATALIGGAALAFKGLQSAAEFTMSSISTAAESETLQTTFVPLLGSIKDAKDRMAELAQFANSTPFELPEVAKASATLETLTSGALSTGKGLTLVGDVASATNTPFSEISVTIGRLYSGLDSGRPVGEAMARLQELGAISPDVRAKLEKLQAEGKKGGEVWAVAAADMARFTGSMDAQSKTWNGKMSNISGAWNQVKANFGEPIMDALKPLLDDGIGAIEAIAEKAKGIGEAIGYGIRFMFQTFKDGQAWELAKTGLKLAFTESVNWLWKAFNGAISAAGQYLAESFENALMVFDILTEGDFWSGVAKALGNALVSAFTGYYSMMFSTVAAGLEKIIKPLASKLGFGDEVQSAADTARKWGDNTARWRDETGGEAVNAVAGLWGKYGDRITTRMTDSLNAISKAYSEGVNSTADVFDASDDRHKMADMSDSINSQLSLQDEQKKKAEEKKISRPTALQNLAPETPKAKVNWSVFGEGSMAKVGGGGYGRTLATAESIPSKQLTEAQKQSGFLKIIAERELGAVL
ncbi:MAG: hypothetical protein RR808_07985 [Akkermansia sp.]